ncbi:MAG: sigma-70 family RNA polymerase sigma factor [Oscillospiraceae bacterium]|nr:sigma-70 family RNA polymerase sigma factor [Oscillospiraceae bacterium]
MSNPNIASRFEEIHNSTYKAAVAFITAKCKNTADIGDILQETYMELYKVLIKRGAEYIKYEKAFVLRIAKHKIALHYSLMEKMRIFVSMDAIGGDGEEVDLSGFEVNAFTMEDYAGDQILLEKARQFVQAKSDDIKKVFYLFYDVGLSIPEIAKSLSMGESNVKNKLYRTIKDLQNLLKE